MSILFVGDMHLDDACWPSRPLFFDAYQVLPQILAIVKRKKVKKIVLCGDVIDRKRINSRAFKELRRFIASCRSITGDQECVYFVQGQHEVSDPPWATLCGGTHLHRQLIKCDGGVTLYGLDYTDTELLRGALESIPSAANLLVCHQMWAEHKPFGPEPDDSLVNVPTNIKTVVSGDIHRHLLKKIDRGGKGKDILKFLSPGTTCMQDIAEEEVKHVWLFEKNLFTKIKLRTRHVIRLRRCVTEQHAIDALKKLHLDLGNYTAPKRRFTYDKDIEKPIVDVEYDKALEDFEDRVRAIAQDRAHLFFRYFYADVPEGEFVTSVEWKSKAAEAIRQALNEETEDPEVRMLVMELIARKERTEEKLKPFLNRYLETGSCT